MHPAFAIIRETLAPDPAYRLSGHPAGRVVVSDLCIRPARGGVSVDGAPGSCRTYKATGAPG